MPCCNMWFVVTMRDCNVWCCVEGFIRMKEIWKNGQAYLAVTVWWMRRLSCSGGGGGQAVLETAKLFWRRPSCSGGGGGQAVLEQAAKQFWWIWESSSFCARWQPNNYDDCGSQALLVEVATKQFWRKCKPSSSSRDNKTVSHHVNECCIHLSTIL